MPRPPLFERVFRALLRVFPAEFRGDFGEQMADDFRDQREDARRAGSRPLVRLWARTIADAVRRGPREHLEILHRDAGYALRLLRRRPGLAAGALFTLAIGIGLNTSVFSLVNGVLWRDLPLPASDRLVRLYQVSPAPEFEKTEASPANFLDWEAQSKTLDALTTIGVWSETLLGDGDPEEVSVARVSHGFSRLVPVRLTLGRLFVDDDYAPLRASFASRVPGRRSVPVEPPVAILSHAMWQRRFHGRPDIIGNKVRLGNGSVEIVGVFEAGFAFPGWETAEVWVPVVPDPSQRRARFVNAFGRLAPNVTLQDAQAEFDVIAGQLAVAYPEANQGRGIRVVGLRDSIVGGMSMALWLLMGAAACVLLIACANVGNLLLAHASGRRLELATRVALGATRGHLVRQGVTEGVLLAGCGGATGFLLAYWTLPLLVRSAPAEIPRLTEVSVDFRVLVFTAVLSIAIGLLCGLAGTLSLDRLNLRGALRAAGADAGGHGRRFRQALTVSQIALALMLVVAAGLLVRTLRTVGALDLGFDPRNVISVGLTPDLKKYAGVDGKARFEAELISRVRSLPGVVAAGIGSRPLGGGGMGTRVTLPEDPESERPISVDAVGPGYLEALGARLVSGRFVNERDVSSSTAVALVNEAAARSFWPNVPAVGRSIVNDGEVLQIVGVVSDVRRAALESEPQPTLYFPSAQTRVFWINNMLVRTTGDPRHVLPAVRAVMRQLDPVQALTRIQTLEERVGEATAGRRQILALVGLFSLIALILAVVGVYGVVAESVAQRVPEIGVRMALGATSADVIRLILLQGSWMVVLGLIVGVMASAALNRVMAGFVFRVSTTDPGTYAIACLCLAAATLAACAIPAARAARVDPVLALRQE